MEVLVPNVKGEARLITRYIHPMLPPKNAHNNKVMSTVEEVVRFVSLIPLIDDWSVTAGSLDVWYTAQDFLDILAGDWEEHATLLCNYFTHIDSGNTKMHNYIVLGNGFPEGASVYVLRYNNIEKVGVLWNACTGVGYSIAGTITLSVYFKTVIDGSIRRFCLYIV